MNETLELKLAAIVQHLMECRRGAVTRTIDNQGLNRLLDDSDIATWVYDLDRAGKIKPQFTRGS